MQKKKNTNPSDLLYHIHFISGGRVTYECDVVELSFRLLILDSAEGFRNRKFNLDNGIFTSRPSTELVHAIRYANSLAVAENTLVEIADFVALTAWL